MSFDASRYLRFMTAGRQIGWLAPNARGAAERLAAVLNAVLRKSFS